MTVVLGVIGIAVAATNVWAFFIQWLSLLGILVPPIGTIILVDQYLTRGASGVERAFRPAPFIAWAIGSAFAFLVEFYMPGLSTALSSGIVAGIAYLVLGRITVRSAQTA